MERASTSRPMRSQNHFELFGLATAYAVDKELLVKRFRELQRATHPDRYVNASDQERRLALQQATQVNEAYQVLSDAVSRARYLLALQGVADDDGKTTVSDPALLMQQMELREQLEQIPSQPDPLEATSRLIAQAEQRAAALEQQMPALFDAQDHQRIKALISELQFLARLRQQAQLLEAELEESQG